MDIQDIAPGQDFAEAIENTISACHAVVVVIGPRWLADLKQRSGGEDFVLHEVSVALRRKVTVIPVLVGGGSMPSAAELPESLAPLSRRQAVEIRDARFDDDAKLLIGALQKVTGLSPAPLQARRRRWVWISLAALLLVAGAGFFFWSQRPRFNLDGVWIAELQKPGQRPFRVRLNLAAEGGRVTGTVTYPTGDGAVQGGVLAGRRLSFFTVHLPQFADREATIRWTGIIEKEQIRVTVSDDAGAARGVARRRP